MLLFDIIKDTVINSTDLSKAKLRLPMPVNKPAIKKCVIGDIMNKPEKFKFEAYIEGKEVIMRIKPKKGGVIDVEPKDSK